MLFINKIKSSSLYRLLVRAALLLACFLSVNSFATSLTEVRYHTLANDQIELLFVLSEKITTQPTITTSLKPARINLTFNADDFKPELMQTLVRQAGVQKITVTKQFNRVIASVHLTTLPIFDISQSDNAFSIILNKPLEGMPLPMPSSDAQKYINNIDAIDFRKTENNEAQLLVYLQESMVAVDVNEQSGNLWIEFHNTEIIEDLIYKLDVTDFGTLVKGVETFRDNKNARLEVDINGPFTFTHNQLNSIFILTVSEAEEVATKDAQADDFSGRAISLNFQDIPVRTVLQIIADYNGFNLVTSDTVTGNITLRLDGVPWDQALEIILKVKGLDKRMEGNILMVAPSEELSTREARDLQAKQEVEDLAALYSEYIQVNYAKASELSNLIKNQDTSILSSRGSVSVDERTNTLLIRDTEKSIEDIKRMVTVLDIPVRQVVIESRMVTVNDSINEELGVRWGITDSDGESSTSGSLEGTESASGGTTPSLDDRLNVNLPVSDAAGSIAFQVARLADGTILDLELSAMEKENKGEVIASPRITTANQKEAYIEQGVEIPYQESASSGATSTEFKKAVLSLTVTPHITPDDRIILDLVVTQDTVSEIVSGSAPAIDTQRIGTQVLVNNGETIVLGGIYQQSIISTVSKVPVLGDIPYLGWLFRNTNNYNEKKELLIFVTPRIVTENF